MQQRRHSDFETWQADVMRTIVDGGPLATSYFASTERHQESERAAVQGHVRGIIGAGSGRGLLLAAMRQRNRGIFSAIAGRLQAMRLTAAKRRSVSPVSAQGTYPRFR